MTTPGDLEQPGIAFTYENDAGITINVNGRGCPIFYDYSDYERAWTEAIDPPARFDWKRGYRLPRVWHLPTLPTHEVNAVRDTYGHLWLRGDTAGLSDNDLWECQREGFPASLHTWYELLEYAPLTDATGELINE